MDGGKKHIPMAQMMVIRCLGHFLSLPHVPGAGIVLKAPLSHISSKGGAWWAREGRKHPSYSRFERGRGAVVALEWAGGGGGCFIQKKT